MENNDRSCESGVVIEDAMSFVLKLPYGYRFNPKDYELMMHYLMNKVSNKPLPMYIPEVQVFKDDPEVITARYKSENNEWYFFTKRDRKYPNGSRPSRSAGEGYWKPTGTDTGIFVEDIVVGYKKTLDYYIGKHPHGVKTCWKMHEYRINHKSTPNNPQSTTSGNSNNNNEMDEFVLCKIYKNKYTTRRDQNNNANTGENGNARTTTSSQANSDPQRNDATTSLQDTNIFQSDSSLYSIGGLLIPNPLSSCYSYSPYSYRHDFGNQGFTELSNTSNFRVATSREENQAVDQETNTLNNVPPVPPTSSELPPLPECINYGEHSNFPYLIHHQHLNTAHSNLDSTKDEEGIQDV